MGSSVRYHNQGKQSTPSTPICRLDRMSLLPRQRFGVPEVQTWWTRASGPESGQENHSDNGRSGRVLYGHRGGGPCPNRRDRAGSPSPTDTGLHGGWTPLRPERQQSVPHGRPRPRVVSQDKEHRLDQCQGQQVRRLEGTLTFPLRATETPVDLFTSDPTGFPRSM